MTDGGNVRSSRDCADVLRVSVVVASRNRSLSLRNLLEAMERQTLLRSTFEVIVVDDASSDETPLVLEEHHAKTLGPFLAIRQLRTRGPAAARNRGWREARAPVIAFTDDDCEPDEEWLEAGLQCLAADCGLVMGRTQPKRDVAGYGSPFSQSMEGYGEDGHYPTCNMFYRRDALASVEGFDEVFRYACAEDTDLAWRVKAAGYRSSFCAQALVVHEVRPPSFLQFLKGRRRSADQVLLVKRHPHLRSLFYRRYFYRRSHVHAVVSVAILAVAMAGWPVALTFLPVIWVDRFRRSQLTEVRRGRLLVASQLLVADFWEFLVYCYFSVRYRVILL